MSLTYNRTLFTQAGLDPDKPPTTWDEVEADAKTIADKTGVAGYAQMATQNTGGWQLTTADLRPRRADGVDRRRRQDDGHRQQPPDQGRARSILKKLRWNDNSHGLHVRLQLGQHQPGVRRVARSACTRAGSDLYTALVQNNNLDARRTTASRPSRSRPTPTPACSAAGPWPPSTSTPTDDQRDAAVDWIDFYYMNKLLDPGRRGRRRQDARRPTSQPVGVPVAADLRQGHLRRSRRQWIKDYINVPTDQMTAVHDGIFNQQLVN